MSFPLQFLLFSLHCYLLLRAVLMEPVPYSSQQFEVPSSGQGVFVRDYVFFQQHDLIHPPNFEQIHVHVQPQLVHVVCDEIWPHEIFLFFLFFLFFFINISPTYLPTYLKNHFWKVHTECLIYFAIYPC